MKIYHSTKINHSHHGSVLIIGKFDGLHLGHRVLIEKARKIAKKHGLPLGALTFTPHPRLFFQPSLDHYLITPDPLREDIFTALGFDFVVKQPFNQEFSEVRSHQFIDRILLHDLEVAHVVVGENFKFGREREGGIINLLANKNFSTHPVPVQSDDEFDDFLSTTKIRNLLKDGKLVLANEQLGHAFTVVGRVFKNNQLGRELGFPTANIVPMEKQILPKFGVYAGRVQLEDGRVFDAAMNWGIRPSTRQKIPMYEAHILDFDEDIYDQEIRVALIEYVREEMTFNALNTLQEKIAEDCEKCRVILSNMPLDRPDAVPVSPNLPGGLIPQYEETKIEAAAFRRVVQHFRNHPDVQNIDLMLLANFCRNCLSGWYQKEAEARGYNISKDAAREKVYGMPYDEWKVRYQTEASPEDLEKLQTQHQNKS